MDTDFHEILSLSSWLGWKGLLKPLLPYFCKKGVETKADLSKGLEVYWCITFFLLSLL